MLSLLNDRAAGAKYYTGHGSDRTGKVILDAKLVLPAQ
jgi:hypothetical protein